MEMEEMLPTPPYGSFTDFQRFRAILKTVDVPDSITPSWLMEQGMKKRQAERILGILKRLKLCDRDGDTTEEMKWLLSDGEDFKESLRAIASKAYEDFLRLEELRRLSKNDLIECFRKKTNCSESTAKRCVNFLKGIAQEANIEVSRELRKEGKTAIVKPPEKPSFNPDKFSFALGSIPSKAEFLSKLPNFSNGNWTPEQIQRVLEEFNRLLDHF